MHPLRLTGLVALVAVLAVAGAACAQSGDNDTGAAPASTADDGGVFSWDVLSSSGLIGLVIAALAFVLLTLVIYYFLTLRRGVFIPVHLLGDVAEALRGRDAKRSMELCAGDSSLLSRALAAGLARRAEGYDEMVEAVETVGQEESRRLHQNVGYLALIGNVSPMLGLLGTVYGMIESFRTVAHRAGAVQPGQLAGGIYTALTTTLIGLTVAIPAMAGYVYFRNRVANLLGETAVVVEELIFPFKKSAGTPTVVPTPKPAPRP